MTNLSELLKMVRTLEEDHDPEGWPAIQMKDVSALARMVEGAKVIFENRMSLIWSSGGWWFGGKFIGDNIETAFYLAGNK